MEHVIERIAKAPVGAKILAVLVALSLLTVMNYFVVGIPGKSILAMDDLKKKRQAELKEAASNLGMKQGIANDLNRFRRQRELLQQKFQEARAELPDNNRMDDLLQALQEKAVRSGLEIARIEPKPVIPPSGPTEFYARIPLAVQLDGNFHEIATFLDSIGRMQRIVNVSDIVLDSPKDVGGRLVITAKFTATTFMFVEPPAAPAVGKGKPRPVRKGKP